MCEETFHAELNMYVCKSKFARIKCCQTPILSFNDEIRISRPQNEYSPHMIAVLSV